MNLVSPCCQEPIVNGIYTESPLGDPFIISYKTEICELCGKEAEGIEQCGICGEIDCLGECEALEEMGEKACLTL
jgi:hypothetical protein